MRSGILVLCMAGCMPQLSALAVEFPTRPIRIVVPFAAGGATDIVGRTVGQKLSEGLKQTVVIDNRPGAGGVLGTDLIAKSSADGYSLLLCSTGPITISPALGQKLPYDAIRDFAGVTPVGTVPYVLLVNQSAPFQTVKDLVAQARARPGQLNYASAGNGSTSHLAAELFKSMMKANVVHVPYKGSAPAATDLAGGQIQMMFDAVPAALPLLKSGKIKALGIATSARSALLPDVPTLSESGMPGYEVFSWYGICAPARTPPKVLTTLSQAIIKGMSTAETRERFANIGAEVLTDTPAGFRKLIESEMAKWSRVIKEAGL
jgi:tripartite-type tricarboxylate transporter receptor subunit TctC